MSDKFEMPQVSVSEMVMFKTMPSDKDWIPAVVLRAGSEGIAVCVHVDTGTETVHPTREGVRHKDDPWLLDPNHTDMLWGRDLAGIFDLSPQRKRLDRLERRVASLAHAMPSQNSTPKRVKRGNTKPAKDPVA